MMNSALTNGSWSFNNMTAFLQDQPSTVAAALPHEANSYRGYRETHVFPYFQDDWRVLPTLTLNLGLRYDFVTNPTEVNDLLCAYEDPSSPTEIGLHGRAQCICEQPDIKSLDPRVGLAWDPFKNHKTSIRAGRGPLP